MILLTGRPRMGKSTAIRKIIHQVGADRFAGFYTEEIRDLNDRIGFQCASVDGEKQEIASVNNTSSVRVGRYGVDVNGFESFAVRTLENALRAKKIIVIDEIGFMQMCSVPFQQMVFRIFTEGNHLVLGTVPLDNHPQIDNIKKLDGVTIVELHEHNRDQVVEDIVEKIVKGVYL